MSKYYFTLYKQLVYRFLFLLTLQDHIKVNKSPTYIQKKAWTTTKSASLRY